MVGFITGGLYGFGRSSASVLDYMGLLGNPSLGRGGEGVYVNASNGNLILQRQDEFVAAQGHDLDVTRTYNSLTNLADDNNDRWRQSTDRRITLIQGTLNQAGSSIQRIAGDGSRVKYVWNAASSSYLSTDGGGAYTTAAVGPGGNEWVWVSGDGKRIERYNNNASGLIKSVGDVHGAVQTFTYDSQGRLSRVTSFNGDWTEYSYANSTTKNIDMVVTGYTDYANGNTAKTLTRTRYAYEQYSVNNVTNWRLKTVTVDLSPGDNDIGDGKTYITTYSYNAAQPLWISQITQSDGSSLEVTYDGAGRVTDLTQLAVSGETRVTHLDYFSGYTRITDPLMQVTRLDYDSNGNLTKITAPPAAAGGPLQYVEFQYNANGDVIRVIDALGRQTNYTNFTVNGEAQTITDPLNIVTTRTFGSVSRANSGVIGPAVINQNQWLAEVVNVLLSETRQGVDATGATVSQTTRYVYDRFGNLRYQISPEGRVIERGWSAGVMTYQYEYTADFYSHSGSTAPTEANLNDWKDSLVDKTAVAGSYYSYDLRQNLRAIRRYGQTTASATGAEAGSLGYVQTIYSYDQTGRLLNVQDGNRNAQTYVYDGLGRLVSETDINGGETTFIFNDAATNTTISSTATGYTVVKTYNKAGELVSVVDSGTNIAARTSTYTYDQLGRIRIKTDPLNVKTYFTYDGLGRQTAEIDADGSMTEFIYDGASRVIATVRYANAISATVFLNPATFWNTAQAAMVRPAPNAADRWSWTVYDELGRVIQTIDANGGVTRFEYDFAGRLALTTRYATALSATMLNGADGISGGLRASPPTTPVQITASSTSDRISRNIYDNDGLLVGTATASEANGSAVFTEYVYDKAGRRGESIQYAALVSNWATASFANIKLQIAANAPTRSDWDTAKNIHNYWIYDARNLLAATINGEGEVTRFHYSAAGELEQEVHGNKVNSATFATYVAGTARPTRATLDAALMANQSLDVTTYNRNAKGQVTSRVRNLSGANQTETTAYTYDISGRLLSEKVSETVSSETRTQSMRYDSLGRLVGQLSGEGSAALAVLGTSPAQADIDNIYALHGTRYVYDASDRLIQKITPDGIGGTGFKTLYFYDDDGQLRFTIAENKYFHAATNQWVELGAEVVENRFSVLEDNTATIVYGTRLSPATFANLTGGPINSALTTAIGGIANAAADSKVELGYDELGRREIEYNPNYFAPGGANANNYTQWNYNAFGELNSESTPAGSNAASGPSGYTPGGSAVTALQSFSYSRRGLLVGTSSHAYSAQGANLGYALGGSSSYDSFGRLSSANQNLIDGVSAHFIYDRAGRLVGSTDRMGNAASAEYSTEYDARGNQMSATDRTNRKTKFDYDLFNRTVTTTTPEGIVSTVRRNAYGQTIRIVDGRGLVTEYEYDKNGNLKKVTEDPGTGTNSLTGKPYLNLITTSTYDNADRLIETTNARGIKTRYTYDAVGRVLTEVRDYGTGTTNPVTGAPYLNTATVYAYDAKGQQISVTDALGAVTTYQYDLKGQTVRVVQDAGVGKLNRTTDFIYGSNGKVSSRIDAAGTEQARTTRYEYDSFGRQTKQVEDAGGLNKTTWFYYDQNDNLIAQIEAPADANGNPAATSDPFYRLTRFVYDPEQRLVLTIDPEGQLTHIARDKEGQPIATRQFAATLSPEHRAAMADFAANVGNQWSSASVDSSGTLTIFKRVVVGATTTTTTAATIAAATTDLVTRTFYDGDGRAAYAVDGEGYVTQNVYDKAGNVIQTIRYTLKTTGLTNASTTANVAALFSTVTNSAAGTLATNIPADAAVTTYTYDGANRLTDIAVSFDSGTGTNNDSTATHFVLDALGQVIETHEAYGTSDVAITRRVFDAVGRMLSETRAYGRPEPEPSTTQYVYDALGRVVKTIDPLNYAAFFYYDNLGRMTWQVDPEGYVTRTEYVLGLANTRVTRFAAIANNPGSLSALTLPDVTPNAASDAVSYAFYDKLGRMIWSVDAEGYAVKTDYNTTSTIEAVTRYAKSIPNHTQLSLAAVPAVTTDPAKDARSSFTYDRLDQVKTATDAEQHVEYFEYNAFGQRSRFTNKLGGITDFAYDKRGLLKTETVQQWSYDHTGTRLNDGASAATSVVTSYDYDARGNLRTKTAGANLAASWQLTTGYDYDKLDRVVRQTDPAVTNPDGSVVTPESRWTYDKRGNVVQQRVKLSDTTWASTFSWYDRIGRKTAEVSPVGTLSEWSYDKSSNLKTQKVWSTPQEQLPTVPGGTAPTGSGSVRETRLSYDKNNRLIESRIVGVRTGAYNGSGYVTAADQDLVSNNAYDAFGNLIKETDANRNAIFHWYDRNGREKAKADQEGYLTTWTRDADGNVIAETRFATKYTGTLATGTAAPTVTATAEDRTTDFSYDKMGRRLTEKRLAVLTASIAGNTVNTATAASTVKYAYNALGEVLSKEEATGDKTHYQYDSQGRLERQLDAVQADFNVNGTAAIRHVSYFYYDGANNLVRTLERAEAGTAAPGTPLVFASGYSETDDRATLFEYSGGKLIRQTDAAGFARAYAYDMAGRRTRDSYTRARSEAESSVTEANVVAYDAAGRATAQWQESFSGGVWTAIWPRTVLNYNAYGEVTSRAVQTSASDTSPLVQEQMVYDNAGRVVKTNAGDGVWKVLAYDANGNATLTLSAITADMSAASHTIDTALAAFGSIDNSLDTSMAATITLYDKRNQATGTREPQRQIDATSARHTIIRARSYTAFGEVASETDARDKTTNYTYNTMGRMLRSIAPTVSITNEDGTSQWVRPATDYYYDAAGRLIATRDANRGDPLVNNYATGGTETSGTIKEANSGNLTLRLLRAGTGYGGSEAQVLKEVRADLSVWENRYDAFGALRISIDGNNSAKKAAGQAYAVTTQSTDKAGRVTQIARPATTYQVSPGVTAFGSLIESYAYDGFGQRIRSWNNLYGETEAARTDYDSLGRVTFTRAQGGDTVSTVYLWQRQSDDPLFGSGGGWKQTATYANGKTMTLRQDSFGREIHKTDLGGNTFTSGYDRGGRLTSRTGTSYNWYNTGQLASTSGSFGTESYSYDAQGNRLSERLDVGGVDRKNATVVYDAMGRMTQWTEVDTPTLPAASTQTSYDANGNIRKTTATFSNIDGYGNAAAAPPVDYWYRYDSLNRLVTDKGSFNTATSKIVRGSSGSDITYDANGNRTTMARSSGTVSQKIWTYGGAYYNQKEDIEGGWGYVIREYQGAQQESYVYDAANRLVQVILDDLRLVFDDGATSLPANPSFGGGYEQSLFRYDLTGRQVRQTEYGYDKFSGPFDQYDRTATFDASGRLTQDIAVTRRGTDTYENTTTYGYGTGSAYALGAVVSQSVVARKNGSDSAAPDTLTTTTHAWWDGAVADITTHDENTGDTGNTVWTTDYQHNAAGQLTYADVNDGLAKDVTYQLDAAGQVIARQESRTNLGGPAPRELFYRFGGKTIGMTGNNGTSQVSYGTSVAALAAVTPSTAEAGLFRAVVTLNTGGGTTPYSTWSSRTDTAASYADFSQSIDPTNASNQGSTASSYTVRGGESLQSIAAGLWGDANLWYKLAEANGLSASSSLSAGQSLILPAGVSKSTHNAETYRPYNPSEAMGDTTPTAPKPPKNNACGTFGMILLVVVAIAVTALTASPVANFFSGLFSGATGSLGAIATAGAAASGTAAVAGGVVGGALVGAASSLASQGLGIALGLQDSINWKGVALAGIAGGIGGGFSGLSKAAAEAGAKTLNHGAGALAAQGAVKASLGGVGAFLAGAGTANAITRAVLSSAAVQGIGKLTGLQEEISWSGVAAAGIGAGIGQVVGGKLPGLEESNTLNNHLAHLGTSSASMLANAATRSVIEGTSFGDNILAALPDVLGQAVFGALRNGVRTPRKGLSVVMEPTPEQAAENAEGVNSPTAQALGEAAARENVLNADTGPMSPEEAQKVAAWLGSGVVRDDRVARQIVARSRGSVAVGQGTGGTSPIAQPLDPKKQSGPASPFVTAGPSRDWSELDNRLLNAVVVVSSPDNAAWVNHPGNLADLEAAFAADFNRLLKQTIEFHREVESLIGSRPLNPDTVSGIQVARENFGYLRTGLPSIPAPTTRTWMSRPFEERWAIASEITRRDVNRTIGGFALIGPVSAVSAIAAPAIFGTSTIGTVAGVFFTGGNSGIATRITLNQEVSPLGYVVDGGFGVFTFGALKGGGALLQRFGLPRASGPGAAETIAPKGTKLIFDRAAKSWTTPEGLIYEQGSKQGNRILHVLDHTVPNPAKPTHTLFSVDRNQVLGLVDKAWSMRGAALPRDPGAFVVPMARAVGQGGETSLKIIVRPNTTKVITAYPVR